jgi:hypothetical protein
MMPQLAHDLLDRANDPEIAAILDNVVFMLWPTINPDGQTMVAEWFMSHVGTSEASAPLPRLYQEYVGHDNNRDAYMLDMIESRVMEHTWREWEPSVIYVQHQAPPFPARIFVPPFAEPIAPHAPPVISQEINAMGMAIAKRLDEHGLTGTIHEAGYDAWYPGYIDYMPTFKNIPAFWTETAGNGAVPREYTLNDIPANMREPKTLYPSPWMGGWWRLGDAVTYDETAAIAVLEFAAKYKDSLLFDRYLSGRAQIANGRTHAPYAFLIPETQRDPVAPVELLRRLAFSGVAVSQLRDAATLAGVTYPAGTWVVPTDQEFAAVAREVLEVQRYPNVRASPASPLEPPYDAAGWTLPLQMGVDVVMATAPLGDDLRSKMRGLGAPPEPRIRPRAYNLGPETDVSPFDSVPGVGFDTHPGAAAVVPRPGRIRGAGQALAVNPAENNAFRAVNRALREGLDVQFVPGSAAGAPRYVISGLRNADQEAMVKDLALDAERTAAPSSRGKRSRLALYDVPTSIDQGWTRWVLDQYGFQYAKLSGTDLQTGSLRDVDVLILTDEPRGVLEGVARGGGRAGAAGDASQPRIGAIRQFVESGGTLVCFNRSSVFAIDQFHLPVKNVIAGLGRQQFFTGGSLMSVLVATQHQVMAGMPERATVFFDGGAVFEPQPDFSGTVLAAYPSEGSPLASGYLLGEQYLQRQAAALDVELGRGHVLLLGFRPQWRGQSFGTFRIIFNAALFGGR